MSKYKPKAEQTLKSARRGEPVGPVPVMKDPVKTLGHPPRGRKRA